LDEEMTKLAEQVIQLDKKANPHVPTFKGMPLEGHKGGVVALAFSPEGRILASGGMDNGIQLLWRTKRESQRLFEHQGPVTSVAFSPDGKLLASSGSDKTIRFWDAVAGKPVRTLQGHQALVISVVFSPNGRTLASGSHDNTVRLWDVATGQESRQVLHANGRVFSVAFSPDGKAVAVASADMTVRLYEVATGRGMWQQAYPDWATAVAFSPDGKVIASGCRDKKIRLSDTATGKVLFELQGHDGPITSLAFSPDGRFLVSGSQDKTVRVWNLTTSGKAVSLSESPRVTKVEARREKGKTVLRVDGKIVEPGELAAALRRAVQDKKKDELLIEAANDTAYQTLVNILNAAKEAGVQQIRHQIKSSALEKPPR
jgi:WD40 repeat protein